MSIQSRVDVHPVGDQFHCHPRVFEQRNDRPRFAGVDRAHRVEQVCAHGRARVDRRAGLVIRRLGVADGGHHACVDDLPDRRKGAVAFGRDGDHADGTAARFENTVDLGRVGIPHQGRLVGAAPLRGEPWPFQMDAVEHTGANVLGQRRDLTQQILRACGDQGSDECGGAVPAVKLDGRGRVVVVGGREVRPSPAVQVGVDEARHHRDRAEVAIRGPRAQDPRPPRTRRRRKPQSIRAATVLGRSAGCRR